MRSTTIVSNTFFLIGVLTQVGCTLALEPQDGTGGSGGSGGQDDSIPSVQVNVAVSAGGSTCTCTGGGDGGADAQTSSSCGSTSSGTGAGGDGSGSGTTSGSGGSDPSTTSGSGGSDPSTTSGSGGSDPSTTSGSGGSDPSTTSGSGGSDPSTTSGSGGSDPSTTSGSGGSDPSTTSGTGGAGSGTSTSGGGVTTGGTGGAGSGGADGAGGSGGAEPSACPGEAHTLDIGDSVSIFASTVGGSNQIDSCYEFEDGLERVYDFTIAAPGTIHISLIDSDSLDAMFVLTPGCGDLSEQRCFDTSADGESALLPIDAGTFSLVVEAMHGTSGDFVLNVDLDAPQCGDGVLNAGEECDVGPGLPGDGCGDPGTAEACHIELPPPNVDTCPGESISIAAGTTTLLASDGHSTLGFTDDYGGSCRLQDGGKDRVFTMTPDVSGTVTARVGFDATGTQPVCFEDWTSVNCWDQLLYARSACASDAVEDELDCADDTGGEGEVISFPVTAGEPFYLFVDGYDGDWYSEGPFNLFVDLVP